MRVFIITTVLILATLILYGTANAECVCECVNGVPQAMCTTAYELRPLCSGFCAAQLQPLRPVIGTGACVQRFVINPYTGQLQWVCQ